MDFGILWRMCGNIMEWKGYLSEPTTIHCTLMVISTHISCFHEFNQRSPYGFNYNGSLHNSFLVRNHTQTITGTQIIVPVYFIILTDFTLHYAMYELLYRIAVKV